MDTKSGRDVRDEKQVKEAIRKFKPDIILSLASTAGIDRVEKDPIGCIETNILGARNILKYKGNAKLVHWSTSEAYGERADRDSEEDTTNVGAAGSPRWTYQASKVCADHLIVNFDKNALIVRPFNVFGPEQVGHGAIADFIQWALHNQDIKIYGDGLQVRSWSVVDDFNDAVFALIENDCSGIYNIGDPGNELTIRKLAEIIIDFCQSKSKLYYVPKREVDVYYRVPNISKLTRDTGWLPKRNFYEELKRTIAENKLCNASL
jgi:UDP-glucuronate decarboxylase